ncbi:ubiquitin carboxyl-terminal hydrolase MINDY-1-like [Haliotis rufescens]|uniref:ubiquitin carboxyl-terminal hydrolase MINDY-1-like n=1 Tax=Haliotis rufescens TaxID=6454 RepID=UPI00201EAA71|nr:ubiquitin carboxyl-terminal hydrolase MINDY-1-like [Haliotis rufescens]
MSSGNDQSSRKSAEGGSEMEASQTQSTSDSSPQARPDQRDGDTNNSNVSMLNEKANTENSDKTEGLNVQAAKPDAEESLISLEADQNGTQASSKGQPEVTPMDQSGSGQPESMDIETDAQPETVELPPPDNKPNAELPHLDEKAAAETSPTKEGETPAADAALSNVVELPPLDESSSGEACASASSAKDDLSGQSVYYIKWIHYRQNKVPIITQNENGPCPLLAIMNVLLLKGKVKLAPMIEMITSEQLMTYLGESILDSMPENLSESVRANYEQNMQDAMSVMYKLQTGLDVNVKFSGVSDFEYTPECIIFDLLGIPLYHGWLVDPQDPVCTSAVGMCSYNQLVEKIIAQKSSEREETVTEALVAEQFLDRTASQLTYYGLCELNTSVKEGELCVFFRNNHFSNLYRVNNELFLLVTDQGFLTESSVVWQTLSNVEGDCHFVDANFRTYTKPEPVGNITPGSVPVGSDQQIDQDYQVALSLQQEAELREEPETVWGQYTQESSALQMADHELARRLQEEEDRRAAAAVNASQQRAAQQQQQGQAQAQAQGGQGQPQAAAAAHSSNSRQGRERPREEKKDKDCTIL